LLLRNLRPPAPIATPAPPLTVVMQLRVGTTITQPGPATIPADLPGRAADLPNPVGTRYITLNEVAPETEDWFLNLNGARFGASVEAPRVGTVEDWVYINLTADTHPMHTHLFMHQVIGRTPFDVRAYLAAYGGPDGAPGGNDPTPFATGPMQPADRSERGFKDTTKANPGYFTTIRGRFDLPSGVSAPQTYVHHCHIVEHEDNDMMQPFTVSS
jgi:spore coat protein A